MWHGKWQSPPAGKVLHAAYELNHYKRWMLKRQQRNIPRSNGLKQNGCLYCCDNAIWHRPAEYEYHVELHVLTRVKRLIWKKKTVLVHGSWYKQMYRFQNLSFSLLKLGRYQKEGQQAMWCARVARVLTPFMRGNVSEPSGFTKTQTPCSEYGNRWHTSSLLAASTKRDPMMRNDHNSPSSRALQRKSPIIHEGRLRHGLRILLIQNADAEYTAQCAGNLMPYLLGLTVQVLRH